MISDHLTGLTSFFPWNLIIALFLAFTFAVIGIAIFRSSIRASEEEQTDREQAHPFLERWKAYFTQFGFFPTNSFSKSFIHALNIMHAFIGGRQFRYQLPWIVMLGAKESGKSTVLQALDLDRPIGRPQFSDDGDTPLCDWWFYNHGIVLDLDGKLVLNVHQATSDEDNWQLFLNLLAHHRSKRPIDGIVLTIPASEIIGQTALSHDDVMIRAEYLYGKLWNMQRLTGMRLPVYLVITKCDLVPGFDSVCKSIPTHNKHDIFGWSNDEPIDAVYNPDWVNMAFSSINDSVYRIQEEIYTQGKVIDERNGVFLFPISLNTLKGGIQTYTNHLFKESSYHESFFLRGIYFVGDSHLDRVLPTSNTSLSAPLTLRREELVRRNIYFVDDLFENKIFREVGLARPISRTLLGNTRRMRFFKAAVAILAVIGTLGLLRANEKLQQANLNLEPALTQVEHVLSKSRGQIETTESGHIFFESQAKVLLNMMTQISVSHLSSVFVPASWFDYLDEKIKLIMGYAYDQVIFRAMLRELHNKALKLTSSSLVFAPVAEVLVDGIDPLRTREFYQLQNYTFDVKQFESIANKFNDTSSLSSLKNVGEIIKYLFNYEMPQSFYENDDYYLAAFSRTEVSTFDFSKYQEQASIKLHKLFNSFQHAAFDPNRMIPGLAKLETSMTNFSGTRNPAVDDVDLLRDVFLSLQQTINSINDPGLDWMDQNSFDPGASYEEVTKIVIDSKFFNPAVAQGLILETNKNFINFRRGLGGYKPPLLSGDTLFQIDNNGLAISAASQGAINLQQALASFFNEPFMASAPDKAIATSIPIGAVLLWDTLRLQEASRMVNDYNKYMSSRFLSLPKLLQPMLQKVARESLTKNLVSFIADAQVFNSDIVTESRLSPEDALLPQVQNYRVTAPYLEQLLFSLRANNANTPFSALKNVLTTQVYGLLQKLDHVLTDESPYAIKLNSFVWWNGKNLAALEAFSVLTLNELKNYLTLQRDRINYLAREFGAPLVSFLEKINMEGMPGNLPLVGKWEGILNELNEYDRKTPGNGLIELENFIMYPLNEVTLATCFKYANVSSMLSSAEDYFVSILVDIQRKLHEQCVALSGVVSVDTYEKLSQFFDDNLAGKFPFVEKCNTVAPDANPEDIRTFFEMMDTLTPAIKATLKEAIDLGAEGKKALTFIEQMERVRSFFGGYLAPNSTLPYPAFSFDVAFRVNQDKEIYGNEILDWELTTQNTTITMRSPSHVGFWQAGEPVSVVFGWALNSPLQPMLIEGLTNFDVQGENAVFSYGGVWALLRLLRYHQATSSDFSSLNDENPITLRFDVPLTNVLSQGRMVCRNKPQTATVFIRVKVSPVLVATPKPVSVPVPAPVAGQAQSPVPGQEKVKMGAPVNMPYFPVSAPHLNKVRSPF